MPINKILLITANKFVKQISKRKLGDLLLLIFLVLITFFVNSFLLTIPPLSYVGDAQRYNGYQAYIMKYSLEHFGQFGLWDQFLSSGMSWISHPGGGQFSPTDWIVITFFKDPMFGSRMIFFLHTFTASIAAYFFLRVIGLQKLTSFFISVASIANVYIFLFVANGWFEEFFGLTIIPLTTGLLLLAFKKKSYLFAVLAALSMSFHFFLNSYYVFHYHVIILLVILFLLGLKEILIFLRDKSSTKLALYKKKKLNNLISFIFLNSVFWTVFIGISAIKLIPLLEFRNLSVRSQLPLSVVESPGHILDTPVLYESLRYFFIDKSHTNWLSHWSNDIGVSLIIIAILYFLLKRSFIFWMLITIMIIGIWGYLANKAPIDFYSLMYQFLPGFDSNNYPYRFIIIIRFAFFACIALGLDLLIKQKKILSVKLLGIFLGLIISIGAVSSIKPAYDGLTYTKDYPINNHKALDNNPENFLIVLKNIVKNSYPDGRVRSTGFYPRAPVSNINSLRGEIPSVHHSYDPIVPTYQYGIILAGTAKDSLYLIKNRYKIFSVLNAKFQVQSNTYFEFWGCKNLIPVTFKSNIPDLPMRGVCNFLENRLKLIYQDEKGAIYQDKDVLPKFALIPNGILLIGDNRLNDFSGFISKKIMFHPDFDVHKIPLLSGGSAFIDDYDLDTLKQFSAILLVDPKIRNKEKIDKMLSSYKDQGGQVIELHSKWIKYDYLHERSDSLFTNNPAWNYSKGDSKNLSSIFSSISAKEEKPGKIEIKKFTPEESIYQITTSKNNQIFQFSDSFYPGWKAEIDGKKTALYMADGLVKGIVIPKKGNHMVRFNYDPLSLKLGSIVTGSTLFFIFGGYILRRRLLSKRYKRSNKKRTFAWIKKFQ